MPLPATGFKPPFKGSVNWSLSAHKSTTPAHGSGLADLLCEEKQAARRSKRMGLTHLPVYTDPSDLKKLVQKAEESDALGIHFHAVQGKERRQPLLTQIAFYAARRQRQILKTIRHAQASA